ncbi:MAG: hypothetical protein AAF346_13410 [Pseudomonadota bacterium]
MSDLLKIIGAAVGMLASGFFLYTNFIVYQHASNIVGIMKPGDPLGGSLTVVDNRHEKSGRLKSGYLAMADFDSIDAGRYVRFSAYVSLRSLLRPGEAPPDRDYREVFAQARAVDYANQECELIQQYFASSCAVRRAKARIEKNGKTVRISASLRFVQAGGFGELDDKSATWSFRDIGTRIKVPETATARAIRGRGKVYRKVMRECAAIRKREGNCAITGLSITARRNRKSALIKMSAYAQYAFLKKLHGV